MITADEARFLMGGRENEALVHLEGLIRKAAMAGEGFIVKSFDPNEYNIGYIGQSLENRGFVVEVDRSKPGPLFYLIISWIEKP